jgi:hypothetical protein
LIPTDGGTSLASLLGNKSLLQQVPVQVIHDAIAMEKTRLLRSILHYQRQVEASTPATSFVQPVLSHEEQAQFNPDATSVANKIGSEIRTGEPYIDVTKLKGIENAEAVAPRPNRGGHMETFPEVSRQLPRYLLFLFYSLSHRRPTFSETPSYLKRHSRYGRR